MARALWEVRRDAIQKVKRLVKRSTLLADLYVLKQRLANRMSRGGDKRVVFFPDTMSTGSSGDLRVKAVAEELKKFGWRVIVVPNWMDLEYRLKVVRRENPHVIFLQQSRHPLNRPRFYPGYATLYDIDDADYIKWPEIAKECSTGASVAVAGSTHLAEVFRGYGAVDPEVVWTGTYIHSVPGAKPNEERGDVITWAHSHPEGYPIEAALIMDVLLRVAERRQFVFRIYSDNSAWTEGYLAPLRAKGIVTEVYGARMYSAFIGSLATAAIGLHAVSMDHGPSRGKSFGKLLAYMAADVAVVTSNNVDHPLFFRNGENGMLVDTQDEWVSAIDRLLADAAARGAMVRAARKDFLERLTTRAVATKLDGIMSRFVARST